MPTYKTSYGKFTVAGYDPLEDPLDGDRQKQRERVRRLKHLKAAVLDKLLARQVNMFDVFEWDHKTNAPRAGKHSCGSVGCMAGWAGWDPKFRKMGFRTTRGGSANVKRSGYLSDPDKSLTSSWGNFFGLTGSEEGQLFGSAAADGDPAAGRTQLTTQRKLVKALIRKYETPLRK